MGSFFSSLVSTYGAGALQKQQIEQKEQDDDRAARIKILETAAANPTFDPQSPEGKALWQQLDELTSGKKIGTTGRAAKGGKSGHVSDFMDKLFTRLRGKTGTQYAGMNEPLAVGAGTFRTPQQQGTAAGQAQAAEMATKAKAAIDAINKADPGFKTRNPEAYDAMVAAQYGARVPITAAAMKPVTVGKGAVTGEQLSAAFPGIKTPGGQALDPKGTYVVQEQEGKYTAVPAPVTGATGKLETQVVPKVMPDGRVHGVLINKLTGETIRDLGVRGTGSQVTIPPQNPEGLSGEAYLNLLPPNERGVVQQIGTGKMPLGRLAYIATRNPGLVEEVASAYPGFDGAKIEGYVKSVQDYTSGKTATALNAGATALKHMAELKALNTPESHILYTPAYTAYKNKLDTVVGELVRFYQMPNTNEARSGLANTLGAILPGNRDAAIDQQIASMADKFASFAQQWKNAAPSSAYEAPMPQIDDRAKADLLRLDPHFATDYPALANEFNPQVVMMQTPDGKVWPILRKNVPAAKKRGAVLVTAP